MMAKDDFVVLKFLANSNDRSKSIRLFQSKKRNHNEVKVNQTFTFTCKSEFVV